MTAKPKLIKNNVTLQPEVAIREKKNYGNTSQINVLKCTNKVVTETVPGNMYIALEDGSLVPIKVSQVNKIVSPQGNTISQCFQTKQVSTSSDKGESKELPKKIVTSKSLTSTFLKGPLMVQKGKSKSDKNISGSVKRKSEGECSFSQNKKLIVAEPEPVHERIVTCDHEAIIDNSNECDVTHNRNDEQSELTDNNSLTGSEEDEYTTPEYLYDENLDDDIPHDGRSDGEDDCTTVQDEDDNMTDILDDGISDGEDGCTTVPDEECYGDDNVTDLNDKQDDIEDSRLASTVTEQNPFEGNYEYEKVGHESPSQVTPAKPIVLLAKTPVAIRPDGILKCHSKAKTALQSKINPTTPSSSFQESTPNPQLSSTRKSIGRLKSKKTVTSKLPRMNEKFPDLPVPTNINQYGDCLKTKLGRYHYGLTLNDPPTQFFQGVLKGASGHTLATMFGDVNLISKFEGVPIEDLSHFAIDTTFRVIPDSTTGVNHVMTISLLFNSQTYPLWYAITSCSSTELYKRILIEFQQHVLDWNFKSVLLNNDPVLCKAVLAVFPDIELYGSWYFYCYSIWKELIINKLTERCKHDLDMMTAVKLLMVVPYLPPLTETPSSITMFEGFQVVKEFAQEKNLPMEFYKVLDYVAAFWFNKVKTKNFTTSGKQTSSLNFVEITQLALLAYMKPNGNVWNLTKSFQSVAKTTSAEFDRYLNGKPPVLKKNRGRRFNVQIRQNMKRLQMGTYDVKKFLEMSSFYCEEMLDIFLHPLYPTTLLDKSNYVHTEGWRIKIVDS